MNDDPALLIDFDALSRAERAPEGQIGNNWHYMCELRSAQEFMSPAVIDRSSTWQRAAGSVLVRRVRMMLNKQLASRQIWLK
jgi:hypothetical protein